VTVQPFTLTTGRLRLDELQPGDAQAVFDYCQDPDFERYLTIPWPYRLADADYFIAEHAPEGWRSGNELTWAMRSSEGGLLGVVGLRTKLERFDIGFWLGAAHRGNGYMPEAVRAVLDWAFDTGFADEVSWECVAGNLASAIVARKLGFTFMGERPSVLPARDGSHPLSWHALLRASDDRTVKPGWPLPAAPLIVKNEGESTP
jgi:RimJ/RimL family protein N-acetyltransferase